MNKKCFWIIRATKHLFYFRRVKVLLLSSSQSCWFWCCESVQDHVTIFISELQLFSCTEQQVAPSLLGSSKMFSNQTSTSFFSCCFCILTFRRIQTS